MIPQQKELVLNKMDSYFGFLLQSDLVYGSNYETHLRIPLEG